MTFKIKHQTQPTTNSCMTTCLAMILNQPAEEVVEKYHDGIFNQSLKMHEVFDKVGISYKLAFTVYSELNKLAIYVLTVPSLNIIGGFHQILFDYRDENCPTIYDPAFGRKDKKYYISPFDEPKNDKEVKLISWSIDYEVVL